MSAPLWFLLGCFVGACCLEFGHTLAARAFESWQAKHWWRQPTRVQALRALLETDK